MNSYQEKTAQFRDLQRRYVMADFHEGFLTVEVDHLIEGLETKNSHEAQLKLLLSREDIDETCVREKYPHCYYEYISQIAVLEKLVSDPNIDEKIVKSIYPQFLEPYCIRIKKKRAQEFKKQAREFNEKVSCFQKEVKELCSMTLLDDLTSECLCLIFQRDILNLDSDEYSDHIFEKNDELEMKIQELDKKITALQIQIRREMNIRIHMFCKKGGGSIQEYLDLFPLQKEALM